MYQFISSWTYYTLFDQEDDMDSGAEQVSIQISSFALYYLHIAWTSEDEIDELQEVFKTWDMNKDCPINYKDVAKLWAHSSWARLGM